MYTADNLEAPTIALPCDLMTNSTAYLDRQRAELEISCQNEMMGTSKSLNAQEAAFTACNTLLGWRAGKMYCDACV